MSLFFLVYSNICILLLKCNKNYCCKTFAIFLSLSKQRLFADSLQRMSAILFWLINTQMGYSLWPQDIPEIYSTMNGKLCSNVGHLNILIQSLNRISS